MADQFDFVTQSSKLGSERETRDRVLDALTIKTLNKLINTDRVVEIVEGCISSGKEANVYHCRAPADEQNGGSRRRIAVKVYATTANIFKSRQVYMQGWHNTNGVRAGREMIAQWATNEFNHLKRLQKAGIPCPEPIDHRDNVLVMSLLGSEDGTAYPRLLNANLDTTTADTEANEELRDHSEAAKWARLYTQLLCYMRRMYKVSRLVHGDLSEYNILYSPPSTASVDDSEDAGTLHIIDVSQSLEHDHPECLTMLRRDINNVNTFFRRKKVDFLNDSTIFEFVTVDEVPIEMEEMYAHIDSLYESRNPTAGMTAEERAMAEVEENEFRDKFIPRTLTEAYELESGGVEADRTAISHLLAKKDVEDMDDSGKELQDDSSESDGSEFGAPVHSGDEEGSEDAFGQKRPRGKKHVDKAEKHAHKMAVKEEKREQRAKKMPKKVKAVLVAKTAYKKTKKK
ncbi:hypothetical protein MKZ38_002765 [Zalerion maritima]|uniref:non-specific serine/threonine protein kinase n=1 Tax=Zalerion maritima TaxID=339359 RepID=A0AAD5RNG3_9PEZI|nr:hypothetical protein MKZ38_002765 [Zalerion maritima]